jgi:hypothetical protein
MIGAGLSFEQLEPGDIYVDGFYGPGGTPPPFLVLCCEPANVVGFQRVTVLGSVGVVRWNVPLFMISVVAKAT